MSTTLAELNSEFLSQLDRCRRRLDAQRVPVKGRFMLLSPVQQVRFPKSRKRRVLKKWARRLSNYRTRPGDLAWLFARREPRILWGKWDPGARMFALDSGKWVGR